MSIYRVPAPSSSLVPYRRPFYQRWRRRLLVWALRLWRGRLQAPRVEVLHPGGSIRCGCPSVRSHLRTVLRSHVRKVHTEDGP